MFQSATPPPAPPIPARTWPRIVLRGGLLLLLLGLGLFVHLIIRLGERPFFGLHRPVSPFVTQGVCRLALRILGVPLQVSGQPMRRQGAMVANHASWLDIFVLNAAAQVYFVSKAEVAAWPLIGWLAHATGTVFIRRDRREAAQQKHLFETRLRAGHRLLFFPEGTSSDSLQVLPFKSTLFEAFLTPELRDVMHIQPVTLVYHAPDGQDPRFYGWWGDMGFASHLVMLLSQSGHGSASLIFHDPLRVADFANRKSLAQSCETTIRHGFDTARLRSVEAARGWAGGA